MLRFCLLLLLATPATADFTGNVRVIDGDTFHVGNIKTRIHGIDAVEVKQTCLTEANLPWNCGAWVRERVAKRYGGKRARCKQVDTDRYGRTVATCKVRGEDVGEWLVSQGLAFAYRKYSMAYDLTEKQAAVADRGLHAHRVQTPAQFRSTRAVGRIPTDKNCRIKGNISQSGKRIFHSPGQKDYERTGIRTEKGERWFCTAAQARAAGWRAARR